MSTCAGPERDPGRRREDTARQPAASARADAAAHGAAMILVRLCAARAATRFSAPTISRDPPSPSVPTPLIAPLVPLEGARQQSVPIYLSAAISARLHSNSEACSLQ